MRRLIAIALFSVASACRCDGPITPVETGFRIDETQIDFGRVLEGTRALAPVNVVNTGSSDLSLTLAVPAPFEVQETLELPGGASVPVDVSFLAGNVAVERTLTVTSPGGSETVTIKGTGVRPLECVPSAPCRTSTYVLETHSCSEVVVPDGSDCTPTSTCLERGQCLAGLCQGVARSCDDNNKCTIDGCAEGIGCVNAPRACPQPTAACRVATCDPGAGCGEAQASDGTPCGAVDCVSASVCAAGACTTVPTPEGFPCSPPTPCQGMGTCQSQVCRRPDAGIMQPDLRLEIGGAPPVTRPMLLSYAGQLFGQVCGLPLPAVRVDGGFTDDGGVVDAGFTDGGFGCALFSYTNNGFERFTERFTDERERALAHVANLGAVLLDDGGLEVRSLGNGKLLRHVPLPAAVHPKGIASSLRGEPWLLLQREDAGSTLARVEDGGLDEVAALDASVQLLALDEQGSAWVSSPTLAGYVAFDDAGQALEPGWAVAAPALTTTLATSGGYAFAGSTQFIASASDAGLIVSPSWLDDAGQPLRVQDRVSLLSRDRAVVFYRQCPFAMMSCAPAEEQLRIRMLSLSTGDLLDDAPVSPPRFDARVVEASLLELVGFPPGVASLVQLHGDGGVASAYLHITIGSMGDLVCPLPKDTEVAAAAIGSGHLWAYVSRDGGTFALEAYPLTGLPLSGSGWPLADGIAGQRRAR